MTPGSAHRARASGALKSIVPAGLLGVGRRPAWRRTRLRRFVSAALVGAAAWLAMSAFLPHPVARGVPTVVVSADLMAGHVLTLGDLVVKDWPRDLSPAGALADPVKIVGRALSAGMASGEAVTAARVRGPGLLVGVPIGLVAAHVRLADPAMAVMANAGDHVDLISSGGKVVASNVVVLAVDAGSPDGGWSATVGSGTPIGVIVAVPREAAARLATVDPSGASEATFSLVVRAAGA